LWEFSVPSLTEFPRPAVTPVTVASDVIFLHQTDAFDSFINGFGGLPVGGDTQLPLGNAQPAYLNRYEVDNSQFDYVVQVVDWIYKKQRPDGSWEWHVFVRMKGVLNGVEVGHYFPWTIMIGPGEFYVNSGIIRPASHPEYIQA
jgi:hypothetical protein